MRNIYFKIIFTLLIITFSLKTNAQTQINQRDYNNKLRFNYMSIKMPKTVKRFTQDKMGLGGLHYQLPINKNFYIGGAMYFALIGDQGGLFTLGAEVGFQKKIYKKFYVDANLHFGGGGGYRVLINGGGYINPNIGIAYKEKNYAVGLQYSYFDFTSGIVRDNALSFYIEIPNQIRTTSYRNANKMLSYEDLQGNFDQKASKSAMLVRFDFFKPINKSRRDIGTPLKNRLNVIGFEYQKYINSNVFLYAHTDAIYKGLRAGFMDIFVGGGFHPFQSKHVDLSTKFALGSAGGRIYPEGGLTMYPSIGLDLKLFKKITLATHLGYIKALDGDFEAKTIGVSLKYNVESGGSKTFDKSEKIENFKTQSYRITLNNQTYWNVPKTDDLEKNLLENLQMLGVNISYDFTNILYIFGEASFAYKERAGGYAHGMFGLGLKTPLLFDKARIHLEIGSGVAGGGGINTKEGIVIRPTLGFSYDLKDNVSLISSVGKFMTPNKIVKSTNFNIGISYNFALLNRR